MFDKSLVQQFIKDTGLHYVDGRVNPSHIAFACSTSNGSQDVPDYEIEDWFKDHGANNVKVTRTKVTRDAGDYTHYVVNVTKSLGVGMKTEWDTEIFLRELANAVSGGRYGSFGNLARGEISLPRDRRSQIETWLNSKGVNYEIVNQPGSGDYLLVRLKSLKGHSKKLKCIKSIQRKNARGMPYGAGLFENGHGGRDWLPTFGGFPDRSNPNRFLSEDEALEYARKTVDGEHEHEETEKSWVAKAVKFTCSLADKDKVNDWFNDHNITYGQFVYESGGRLVNEITAQTDGSMLDKMKRETGVKIRIKKSLSETKSSPPDDEEETKCGEEMRMSKGYNGRVRRKEHEEHEEEHKGVDWGEEHPEESDAEPFHPKPSAQVLAHLHQHYKSAADYIDGELPGMDHPELAKALHKHRKSLDQHMEHMKDLLHSHHGEEGDEPDELMEKHCKALGQDTSGESEVASGEMNPVERGEVPEEEEDNPFAESKSEVGSPEWESEEAAEPEHGGGGEHQGAGADTDTQEILERYQHPKTLQWMTRKVALVRRSKSGKMYLVKTITKSISWRGPEYPGDNVIGSVNGEKRYFLQSVGRGGKQYRVTYRASDYGSDRGLGEGSLEEAKRIAERHDASQTKSLHKSLLDAGDKKPVNPEEPLKKSVLDAGDRKPQDPEYLKGADAGALSNMDEETHADNMDAVSKAEDFMEEMHDDEEVPKRHKANIRYHAKRLYGVKKSLQGMGKFQRNGGGGSTLTDEGTAGNKGSMKDEGERQGKNPSKSNRRSVKKEHEEDEHEEHEEKRKTTKDEGDKEVPVEIEQKFNQFFRRLGQRTGLNF